MSKLLRENVNPDLLPQEQKISLRLIQVLDRLGTEPVAFREFIKAIGEHPYPVFILFLALPFISPIPLPGISAPFGLVIAWLGVRLASGLPEKMPEWLLRRKVSPRSMRITVKATSKVLSWIERMAKPRLSILSETPRVIRWNFFLIGLAGAVLAIPAPIPFINGLPAWWIILLLIGILEKDGRFILAGYILYVLGTIYLVLVTWLGVEFLIHLGSRLIQWLGF